MTALLSSSVHPLPGAELTVAAGGPAGAPVALVLHGGGGPATVTGLAAQLAGTHRVLAPTLPGWDGTRRPPALTRMADVAQLCLALLAEADVRDALVVGSSLGGWVAAEMTARDDAGRVGAVVLLDAVGIAVEGAPIADFFALTPRELAEHAYADPERFFADPAALPPERAAQMGANAATMRALAGDPYMHDPELLDRLGAVTVPVLALWGEADRIVTPAYGRAYAAAFPHGRFTLLPGAGHLPQLEAPEATFAAIDAFAAETSSSSPTSPGASAARVIPTRWCPGAWT